MSQHCEIQELFGDGSRPCPVCATTPTPSVERDAWEELRALVTAPEPEPLVLSIPA